MVGIRTVADFETQTLQFMIGVRHNYYSKKNKAKFIINIKCNKAKRNVVER
jgi:hypothetical protein